MSPILKFLTSLGLKAAEDLGEALLEETLQKWHDADPEEFNKDIPVLLAMLTRLKDFTDKTASKWDDPFVNVLYEAVLAVQKANQLEAFGDETDPPIPPPPGGPGGNP